MTDVARLPASGAVARAVLLAAVVAALLPFGGRGGASAATVGETHQRTITYDVRTRGEVLGDVAAFARVANLTLNDRRGWSQGGSIRFLQVPSSGAFTLWLASPATMGTFSSVCSAQYSCRSGRNVIINDERWRRGTPTWPAVREYRSYVINHEVGHWFGLGHAACPAAGAPAPVMQQQSKGLGGCRSSTWPTEGERRAAARGAQVQVRSKAPNLTTVDRAGSTSTDVHTVSGASRYSSWVSRLPTALPRSNEQEVSFGVGDHNLDGVDDLYVVEHPSGASAYVRVLSGADRYQSVLRQVSTPLRVTDGASWSFHVADYNGDGQHDLIGVNGSGASRTEVHVLDGGSGFTRFSLNRATPLHRTNLQEWAYAVGDHNRDGIPDLYALARTAGSGQTAVHVLSGSTAFNGWLAQKPIPLGHTSATDWSFHVGDIDGDGFDDLAAIKRTGSSGHTEVHALRGTTSQWLLQTATVLGQTAGERWAFALS